MNRDGFDDLIIGAIWIIPRIGGNHAAREKATWCLGRQGRLWSNFGAVGPERE